MNRPKILGTRAETIFVTWLKQHYPWAERRALNGGRDRGDVAGIPGTVIEVKAGARLCIPEWLRELDVEMVNDDADFGFLAIKPKGVAQGAGYWVLTRPEYIVRLMKEAGR